MKEFTEEQIERYSRHILLSELGGEGQKKLLSSSAFVVGAGGLGSPALLYLAAAGVGKLGIADDDTVEMSNLQRQIIHRMDDLGHNKAASAGRSIKEINPGCQVEIVSERLGVTNIRQVLRGYDVVLDGSDNFPTRFLVADCCRLEGIPLVSAAVLRFEGQLMTVLPGDGNPCYRCLWREPPPAGLVPSCQEAGVLGAVVGVMGILQATEAVKLLAKIGRTMSNELLIYEALECRFSTVRRAPDPDCPLCGRNTSIRDLFEYQYSCDVTCDCSPNKISNPREIPE